MRMAFFSLSEQGRAGRRSISEPCRGRPKSTRVASEKNQARTGRTCPAEEEIFRPAISALAAIAFSSVAGAAGPVFDEGFIVSLGTFGLDTKTEMRVDGTTDVVRQRSQRQPDAGAGRHRR